jgi:hypothetical protein
MKSPTKEWHGHTWVGWLNLLFFRWLFIRLAWIENFESPDNDAKIHVISHNAKGNFDATKCNGFKLTKQQWTLVFRWPWRW